MKVRLGDVATVQTGPFGSQLHQSDYVESGVPIVTVEHLGDNRLSHVDVPMVSPEDYQRLIKYVLRQNDIVFSRVGSVDRRALVRAEEEGWLFSGRCLRVRPDPTLVDPACLSYFFGQESFREHIRQIAVGATMPSLNTGLLSGIELTLPSLSSQREIGRILTSLDDKIELNRRMNETLEAMARAIFRSWFVDFDPVRIKARGGDPTAELGLSPEIAALFPDSFQDSELGEIPAGWEVGPSSDFCEVTIGGIWGTDCQVKQSDVQVLVLRGVDLEEMRNDGWYPRAPRRWVPASALASRRLSEGEVLIGGSGAGPCGRPLAWSDTYAEDGGLPVMYSNFVKRLKCESRAQAVYLDRVFWEMFNDGTMSYFIQGTSVPNLNDRSLLGYEILRPPQWAMEAFSDLQASITGLRTTRESRLLAQMRDYLLPALLSGKVGGEPA